MAINKFTCHSVLSVFLVVCYVSLVLAEVSCQTEPRFDRRRQVNTEKRVARQTRAERNAGERRYGLEEREREGRIERETRRGEGRIVHERDQRRMMPKEGPRQERTTWWRNTRNEIRSRRDDERRSMRADFRNGDSFRREKEIRFEPFEKNDNWFYDRENREEKIRENSSWEKMSVSLLLGVVGYTIMTPAKVID